MRPSVAPLVKQETQYLLCESYRNSIALHWFMGVKLFKYLASTESCYFLEELLRYFGHRASKKKDFFFFPQRLVAEEMHLLLRAGTWKERTWSSRPGSASFQVCDSGLTFPHL